MGFKLFLAEKYMNTIFEEVGEGDGKAWSLFVRKINLGYRIKNANVAKE